MKETQESKPWKLHLPIRQNGIALLVVLWVMAILTVMVGQFCYSMRTETNITRHFRDSAKAYYQARAGVEQALIYLQEMGDIPAAVNKDTTAPVVFWRINADNPSVPLEDGSFRVRLGNTQGKININIASPTLLKLLLAGLELDQDEIQIIVDSILDWRDKDNFHRLNGAENDYYQQLPDPYFCENGPFQSLDELLLVRGITKNIFKTIRNRVTLFPTGRTNLTEKNKKKSNQKSVVVQKQININAAPRAVLSILPDMNKTKIDDIVTYRNEADFFSLDEVKDVVGAETYAALSKYITLENSSCYTIRSTGMINNAQAQRSIKVTVILSPESEKYQILRWADSAK